MKSTLKMTLISVAIALIGVAIRCLRLRGCGRAGTTGPCPPRSAGTRS